MSQEASSSILMVVIMIGLFYFMLYRPQKKQAAKRKALLDSLQVGNDVVTIGGVYGTIREMDKKFVKIEVADGVLLTFARSAVSGKVVEEADDDDDAEEA